MSRSSRRFPLSLFPACALCTALLFGFAPPARAIDRAGYSMEVLVGGIALQEYLARNATYIEALEGREYSIRLTNHTGERIAVALSVDGLNSIDAKTTTARAAQKWILGPWESVTLDGWQTSSSTARHFFFTSEKESYGAWLGKTKNLGIVAAAVFREKHARHERRLGAAGESKRESDASAAAPSAPQPSDELAATGIGRELGHEVMRVDFDAQPTPAAMLELRYEYRDALVKLGVLPRPCPDDRDALARREHSHGFADPGFAPDPFRRR